MAHFLLLETSGDICSVGISRDNEMLFQKSTLKDFSHSENIILFIEEGLIKTNLSIDDISCIGISSGPGSYTGLRIASSVAKGICYAKNIPLIAIDSITALANSVENVKSHNVIVPIIDARRMDVYTAAFNANMQMILPITFKTLEERFIEFEKEILIFVGSGVTKLKDTSWYNGSTFLLHDAEASHLLKPTYEKFSQKLFEDIKKFSPFYLKNPNITTPKKQL